MSWLRRQRRRVELELNLMAYRYDLDGALLSDQDGLAWLSRHDLLINAMELHLRDLGVEPAGWVDRAERACFLAQALARVNPGRAAQVWQFLEEPAPLSGRDLRIAVDRSLRFMSEELGVAAAESRDDAVRAWADATKLLREIAQGLGMAKSDDWYLSGTDGTDQLAWYDEVLSVLDGRSAAAREPAIEETA